jgi:hypothetical protein
MKRRAMSNILFSKSAAAQTNDAPPGCEATTVEAPVLCPKDAPSYKTIVEEYESCPKNFEERFHERTKEQESFVFDEEDWLFEKTMLTKEDKTHWDHHTTVPSSSDYYKIHDLYPIRVVAIGGQFITYIEFKNGFTKDGALNNGDPYYYDMRYASCKKRHPSHEPPEYYMDYGAKYCRAFLCKTYFQLSEEGRNWLVLTLKLLQRYMEQGVVDKSYIADLNKDFNKNFIVEQAPATKDEDLDLEQESSQKPISDDPIERFYTQIECDNDRFKEFAFATHPDAHRPKKMRELPFSDKWVIANTPEKKEFLDPLTREQVEIVLKEMYL